MSANPARRIEDRLRQTQEGMLEVYQNNHMNELKKYSAILEEKQKFDILLDDIDKEIRKPMTKEKERELGELLTDMEEESDRLNEAIRQAKMEVAKAWELYENYSKYLKRLKAAEEWKRGAERRFLGRGGATRRRRGTKRSGTKRRGTLKSKKLR